jgi:hypothetical protein
MMREGAEKFRPFFVRMGEEGAYNAMVDAVIDSVEDEEVQALL